MKKNKKTAPVREDKPSKAEIHHGSTTQGGSNFGQGSNDLGKHADSQGSESNEGANYEGEQGWYNEALRREDMPATDDKKEKTGESRSDDQKK